MALPFQIDATVEVGVEVPPPRTHKPLRGQISDIHIRAREYRKISADTRARNGGLRFEWAVQTALIEYFGIDYYAAPGVYFTDDSGLRVLLPDGILRRPHRITVVEIKSQHMPEAWWQLKIYREVLEVKFHGRQVVPIEIVRTYDPLMPFPCKVDRLRDVGDIGKYTGDFGVLIWPR